MFVLMFAEKSFCQQHERVDYYYKKNETAYKRKPWKGNNKFLQQYLKKIEYFGNENKIRYLVPVQFFIYHNNDGSGGASYSTVDTFMNDLNHYYKINKTGLKFYICNIKEINRTKRKILGYRLEAPLQTFFRRNRHVVNVHIIDGFKLRKNARKLVRGNYNYISKAIIVRKVNSSTGLSHEVGHYFGLLHPHRNYNKGISKQEPVSRTRTKADDKNKIPLCEIRGDYLADTPAEPKLTFLINNDCEFVGSALTDEWGDNYAPDVNNIMSYPANYYCRNKFTLGQIAVMLYEAEGNKCSKFWSTNYPANKKYEFDNAEPNEYFEMASPIELDSIHKFNFHKIFINKRKEKSDTCDWYKFELKKSVNQNVEIVLERENDNIITLSVELFDKNKIKLAEKMMSKENPIRIGYKGLVSDWYYIKVSTPETKKTDKNLSDKFYSLYVKISAK